MTQPELLFRNSELSDFLRSQEDSIAERVKTISREEFIEKPNEQIIEGLLSDLAVEPLAIDKKGMTISEPTEATRPGENYGEPIDVGGMEITYFIPFTGLSQLWEMRPNSFSSMFPRAIIGENNVLITIFMQHSTPVEEFEQEMKKTVENICFYLKNQRHDIDLFKKGLPELVNKAVITRRDHIDESLKLSDQSKIPLHKD